MRDRALIGAGLLVFVAVATFPIWRAPLAGTTAGGPDLQLPAGQTQCVAARDYMRTSHMSLLLSWRDGLVRHQQTTFTTSDGRSYPVSLAKTCAGECHESKADFCDSCHAYAGAPKPYCWDCHQTAVSAGGVK